MARHVVSNDSCFTFHPAGTSSQAYNGTTDILIEVFLLLHAPTYGLPSNPAPAGERPAGLRLLSWRPKQLPSRLLLHA